MRGTSIPMPMLPTDMPTISARGTLTLMLMPTTDITVDTTDIPMLMDTEDTDTDTTGKLKLSLVPICYL